MHSGCRPPTIGFVPPPQPLVAYRLYPAGIGRGGNVRVPLCPFAHPPFREGGVAKAAPHSHAGAMSNIGGIAMNSVAAASARAEAESRTIYQSDTLLVRGVAGPDRTGWIVSFDHFRNEPGFAQHGFGEAFLRDEGYSAVHVLCCDNRWYQYPDMLRACAAVRQALAGAERILTYGSSMGAYAALRLGKAVGATATLAISPQYSIDPAKAPWEWRWNQYKDALGRCGWLEEIDGPIDSAIVPYVAFDPTDLDLRHVERIEQDIPIRRLPFPHVGHPATGYLGEIDLLRPLLRAIYDGGDALAIARAGRERRRTSSFYLGTLASKQPACRLNSAIRLAETAVIHRPQGPMGHYNLAKLLTRAGRHAEAIAIHARVAEMTDRAAMYLPDHADALAAAGDMEGAVAVAIETASKFPDAAHIHHWLAHLLCRFGDRGRALQAARRAVAVDPSPSFRASLERFEAELRQSAGAGRAPARRSGWIRRLGARLAARISG